MFDAHPPFQIDGNFGGTAGIAEMLLQSHAGEIEFLPALRERGRRCRHRFARAGELEVGLSWKNGALISATVRALAGQTIRLRNRDVTRTVNLADGQTYQMVEAMLRTPWLDQRATRLVRAQALRADG